MQKRAPQVTVTYKLGVYESLALVLQSCVGLEEARLQLQLGLDQRAHSIDGDFLDVIGAEQLPDSILNCAGQLRIRGCHWRFAYCVLGTRQLELQQGTRYASSLNLRDAGQLT